MAFAISSTSFPNGGDIPKKFTCDGADVSPEFSWTDPPDGTQCFVLIADDPDAPAGTWAHWVLFDLPANLRAPPHNFPNNKQSAYGSLHGPDYFREIRYCGAAPPAPALPLPRSFRPVPPRNT